MFFLTLNLQNDRVIKLNICIPHNQTGYIALFLKDDPASSKLLETEFSRDIKDLKFNRHPFVVVCDDATNFEKVFICLKKLGWLSTSDERELANTLIQIKSHVKQAPALTAPNDPYQKYSALSTARSFIDDIIYACDNYKDAVTLLRVAFGGEFSKNAQLLTSFLIERKMSLSLLTSVKSLTAMVVSGTGFDWDKIRFTLHDLCELSLSNKFSCLDDRTQLVMYMGFLMMRGQCRWNPFDDFERITERALLNTKDSTGYFAPAVSSVMTQALACIGILAIGKQPDLIRIKALANSFSSPIIHEYLSDLAKIEASKNNPLLLAIKADNPEAIHSAIEGGMPVNMHFVNEGRTPLIAAVQECGIPALKAILSHNPDKNAYNAFGTYTPIFAAIKLGSIEKVTLLIDSGASIFRRCGISNGNAGLFINRQNLVLSFALNAAISRYNETKTENALKIVDFILKRGGALCTDLTTCPLAVCDLLTETTLALGANLPQALVSKPITTVAMFIQKIDKRDYPQQLSTVQLAILSMNPQLDELTKLYLHLKISEPVILLLALHPEYAPIMDALDKQEYSLALRRACVCENHPDGLKIASVIMEHAKGLSLKIDECTSKGKSAYDLATDAGNAALCASIRNYYPSVRIRSANSM